VIRVFRPSGPRWLSERDVRAAVTAAFDHARRRRIAIDVVLVDDRTLAELHERFLGDPSPTDVMAFDLSGDAAAIAGGVEAEIYASHECARRVAAARGVHPARELCLYVVHGALHLCGFDDRSAGARRRMRRAEARIMKALGFPPDPGRHV
jgi:probable rRNA maturation factor